MAVVAYEEGKVKASTKTEKRVRGGKTIPVEPHNGYTYKIAKVTPIDGDSDGQKTFLEVFSTLTQENYRQATKFLVKGFNFYSKKSAAPKSDRKKLDAIKTLADSLGVSFEEMKAKLGLA